MLAMPAPPGSQPSAPAILSHYDCAQLEALWIAEGGAPGEALTAARIATAESGGNPSAISPTDDVGLWQVNAPSWGAMASVSPVVSARSAIAISHDGTDWLAWTTYANGAYLSYC